MNEMNEMNEELKPVTVQGSMTVAKTADGLRFADFNPTNFVEAEAFVGRFKVQGMRDGKVYLTELPRRVKEKPLFRLDNSSMSLGKNGVYYFIFRLAEGQVAALPSKLVREANEAAVRLVEMVER